VALTRVDPGALVVMKLCSELCQAQETIKAQRRQILAMTAVMKAQQIGSAALVDLVDALLSDGDDG
jgi:hypothetical protein